MPRPASYFLNDTLGRIKLHRDQTGFQQAYAYDTTLGNATQIGIAAEEARKMALCEISKQMKISGERAFKLLIVAALAIFASGCASLSCRDFVGEALRINYNSGGDFPLAQALLIDPAGQLGLEKAGYRPTCSSRSDGKGMAILDQFRKSRALLEIAEKESESYSDPEQLEITLDGVRFRLLVSRIPNALVPVMELAEDTFRKEFGSHYRAELHRSN
jgi:hypothetical protein